MTSALCLTSARLIDGTGAPPLEGATVLMRTAASPASRRTASPRRADVPRLDLGGKALLPGLVDAHVHVTGFDMPEPLKGRRRSRPRSSTTSSRPVSGGCCAWASHTVRDVGAFGDDLLHARRAVRLGAVPGPRILACGRIVSATSAGGRHFEGMYREATGPRRDAEGHPRAVPARRGLHQDHDHGRPILSSSRTARRSR